MIAMVRHRDRLSVPLCFVIHAARSNRVHVAPVSLRLRVHKRVAVGLGCGREQEARALLLGKTKHVVCAKGTYLQCLDWEFKVVNGGCRTCEMEYVVDLVPEIEGFCHIVFEVGKPVRLDVFDVLCTACHQIVYTDNLVSIFEQEIAKM